MGYSPNNRNLYPVKKRGREWFISAEIIFSGQNLILIVGTGFWKD